jgi:hypothetical protein
MVELINGGLAQDIKHYFIGLLKVINYLWSTMLKAIGLKYYSLNWGPHHLGIDITKIA